MKRVPVPESIDEATQWGRISMTIEIKWNERYAGFEGWGTSLAWWGHIIGSWKDQGKVNRILDLVFDPTEGLGLNIVRYNIGGGERPGPNTLRPGGDVPSFQPEKGHWDWEADAGQRAILQGALNRGVTIAEAFSNSPPYWMTISGSVTGAVDGKNNLKEEAYDDFADYLAQVVKTFRDKWGITFRTLNPLNEPSSHWWMLGNIQEGCYFDFAKQGDIIRKVEKALHTKGLTGTTVSANDDNSIDETIDALNAYDEATLDAITQINTHSYNGKQMSQLREMVATKSKRLWMSEYGTGGSGPHSHEDMTSVLELAERVILDLAYLQPAAWIYWQAVEDEGANNNWGFIHANFIGEENYELNKQFYAMAQFSKFIRPGAIIAPTSDESILVAYDTLRNELILVMCNNAEERTATVDLPFIQVKSEKAVVYRTSETENLIAGDSLPVTNGKVEIWAPARSITTVVIPDCRHYE